MKDTLRQNILKKRQAQKRFVKKNKDKKIMKKLFLHPLYTKAKNIFLYVSFGSEVDTHEIIRRYSGKKHLIVPKAAGNHSLRLFEIGHHQHLEKGKFGILEPKKHLPKIHPSKVELAIVPGIVFDKRGHRIGYGRGYMDRLFTKMKCPKIGLAYDFQMVDKIPEGPYDVPVDFVVTEKKIYPACL